ncbi:MerR family DNA-binding transcriptional regulator [Gemmatimonadota bacterium]
MYAEIMKPNESNETVWLSLSEAALQLNVHPATLRRWADEGQVSVMRTPGGHRRFAASDIAHLTDREHAEHQIGPVERMWAERAMQNTRDRLMEVRDEGWMSRLDQPSKITYRRLGQELLDQTLRFLINEDTEAILQQDAHEIGQQYAEIAVRNNLSLTDVLRAFMLFHDSLTGTAIELPEDMSIPHASRKLLMNRINLMLNTVQLGIAETWEKSLR